MRVVAGELRSRRLTRPPEGVRPTADRVREALFARLGDVRDARVLDLYAGTGALAIEALSRGATSAVLVERSPRALAAIRTNVSMLGLVARARVLRGDAAAWVGRLGRTGDCFDLIFVDPPYATEEVERALRAVVAAGVLAPEGEVVVETAKDRAVGAVDGLASTARRVYGDTAIEWLAPVATAPGPAAGGVGQLAPADDPE